MMFALSEEAATALRDLRISSSLVMVLIAMMVCSRSP